MNNICFVNTMRNGFGNDRARRVLYEDPKPHEPVLFGIQPLEATPLIIVEPSATGELILKCIHCGSLYSVEKL